MQAAKDKKASIEGDANKLRDSAIAIVKDKITVKQVKKVNEWLGKATPPTLVKGLETLIALMRNHHKASNVDVEIYFKEHMKLTKKMIAMQGKDVDVDIVEQHMPELAKSRIEFAKDFPDLVDIIDWGTRFCEYSLKSNEVRA